MVKQRICFSKWSDLTCRLIGFKPKPKPNINNGKALQLNQTTSNDVQLYKIKGDDDEKRPLTLIVPINDVSIDMQRLNH